MPIGRLTAIFDPTPFILIVQSVSIQSPLIARLLLLLLVLVGFSRIFNSDFVNIDDSIHTYRNPHMNPPTWEGLKQLWREPYRRLYIPLTYTAWTATSVLATKPVPGKHEMEFRPRAFHLLNVTLHLLTVLCFVYPIFFSLSADRWASFLGAAVFAVHPLQVEPVCWISGLKDVLYGFFAAGSLYCYVKYCLGNRRLFYVGSLLLFLLSLLSKPNAVALPLMLMALGYFYFHHATRRVFWETCSWLFFAVPFALITSRVQNDDLDFAVPNLIHRPLIFLDALAFYIRKTVLPVSLGLDYGQTPAHILQQPGIYFVALAGLFIFVTRRLWRNRTKRPWLLCGAMFCLANWLPVSGLVPFVFQNISTTADRYCYVGFLGIGLIVAGFAAERVWTSKSLLLVSGLILAMTLRSAEQTKVWDGSLSLFTHAIKINPRSWLSYNNLGVVYEAIPNIDAAAEVYRRSSEIKENPTVFNNLGAVLLAKQDYLGAQQAFENALRLRPEDPMLFNNLGTAMMAMGNFPKARDYFMLALRGDPGLGQALDNVRKLERLSKKQN